MSSTETRGNTGSTRDINSRAKRRERDPIDQAAERLGKTRTDFMLEPEHVLLDQRVFTLDPRAVQMFQTLLDSAHDNNPKLRKLTATRAPWEP